MNTIHKSAVAFDIKVAAHAPGGLVGYCRKGRSMFYPTTVSPRTSLQPLLLSHVPPALYALFFVLHTREYCMTTNYDLVVTISNKYEVQREQAEAVRGARVVVLVITCARRRVIPRLRSEKRRRTQLRSRCWTPRRRARLTALVGKEGGARGKWQG